MTARTPATASAATAPTSATPSSSRGPITTTRWSGPRSPGGAPPGERGPLHRVVVIGPRLEDGVAEVGAVAADAVAGVRAVIVTVDPERRGFGAHALGSPSRFREVLVLECRQQFLHLWRQLGGQRFRV